jgi:hypothetical protein
MSAVYQYLLYELSKIGNEVAWFSKIQNKELSLSLRMLISAVQFFINNPSHCKYNIKYISLIRNTKLKESTIGPLDWVTKYYQQDAPGCFGDRILVPGVGRDPVTQGLQVVQQELVRMFKFNLRDERLKEQSHKRHYLFQVSGEIQSRRDLR